MRLTVEDLRVLIRQGVGLVYVLPLALEVLREQPLAEGDLYEGELLSAVLTRTPETWKASPALARDLRPIVPALVAPPSFVRQAATQFLALIRSARSTTGDG
ncbi:contact-dependent growth inhibition system immunity protein [Streptomyces sp. NBC_01230]|uniref:contact-dependent growth inhibition system immunity protein n=1 Tax=Streptomyces sp. NBC_00055 TaxID=2975632 RepID=UPI00324B5669|nr:contact-dependent growth inhibition system immunity protein [Streptomyces sp. NBC_01230]